MIRWETAPEAPRKVREVTCTYNSVLVQVKHTELASAGRLYAVLARIDTHRRTGETTELCIAGFVPVAEQTVVAMARRATKTTTARASVVRRTGVAVVAGIAIVRVNTA